MGASPRHEVDAANVLFIAHAVKLVGLVLDHLERHRDR